MALKDAVKLVVDEFVAAQKTFSAWDVTLEVRARANAGRITLGVGQTSAADGSTVPDVPHAEVRDEVHELLGLTGSYERNHNGQYWVYSPTQSAAGQTPAVSGTYNGSSTLG